MKLNRLTAIRVQQIRKPGFYSDGGGLYLQVTEGAPDPDDPDKVTVNKSWLFRFSVSDASKPRKRIERWMGLGPLGTVSLAEARVAALKNRQLRLNGIDPIEAKRSEKAAAKAAQVLEDAKAITFKECASTYIEAHRASWHNPRSATQWERSLTTYAQPISTLPVNAIDTGLVLKVLEPIWTTMPVLASRVRGRLESILDWAKVREYRTGENPARWRGHLESLLPEHSAVHVVKHFPSLPYARIGAFMQALRKQSAVDQRALEFAILTGMRTDAVIGARWSEINMAEKVWTVPPERMKRRKRRWTSHRVALSSVALKILANMDSGESRGEFVFPGSLPGRPLTDAALLDVLEKMESWVDEEGRRITTHGFRSTLSTWAAERTNFPADLVKVAIGQTVGSKVDEAYQRGDKFEKRQRLMEEWAKFCAKPASETGANVVPMSKPGPR
jgi:integrase